MEKDTFDTIFMESNIVNEELKKFFINETKYCTGDGNIEELVQKLKDFFNQFKTVKYSFMGLIDANNIEFSKINKVIFNIENHIAITVYDPTNFIYEIHGDRILIFHGPLNIAELITQEILIFKENSLFVTTRNYDIFDLWVGTK